MRRTSQGGSVFGFIISGILLTFLLVGAIYVIHQQISSPQPVTIPPVEQPSPESEQPPTPTHETTPEPVPSQQTPVQLPSGSATPREIPQTGPREMSISAIAAALLVGTLLAYTRSRRSVASL